jgi:maltooligosyltrehalose trehalohydrolase
MRDRRRVEMTTQEDGYHSVLIPEAKAGDCYRYEVKTGAFPDPASRFQPDGPHGPSQVIDPLTYDWTDREWRGVPRHGQVIYEMHIGTFSPTGDWAGAEELLPNLVDLGVTVLEVMPVADFPGNFGWGYDGVNLFAPTRLYGQPDDFRQFVDRAHQLGLGVILDVVYNHLGPDGNYLREFSPSYFSDRYENEWGDAINFDDKDAAPVREIFIANAAYWIREYHLDGLRFDATQQMFDASPEYVVAEMAREVRKAAPGREVFLVAENEPQDARLVRAPEQGGYGLDAIWSDDFHHSVIVALTGRNEAYYTDHCGRPQEFVSAAKYGFLYQGQRYEWQKKRRGAPALDLKPDRWIFFVENHDQVANSLWGRRLHQMVSPGDSRAVTALLLLGPATPLLFQGQEFASSQPFLYFGEHTPELAALVAEGRRKFLSQFPSIASAPPVFFSSPEKESTFKKSKLKWAERESHVEALKLHRDLLHLRRTDPVLASIHAVRVDGAVLGEEAFLLRYFSEDFGDRLLLINFGHRLRLVPAPEPLLAPGANCRWVLRWSSEEPSYGGSGTPAIETDDDGWCLPAHAAVLMISHSHLQAPTPDESPTNH